MTVPSAVYPGFAALLAYPANGVLPAPNALACRLERVVPGAAAALRRFDAGLAALGDVSLEELYTRTFDVAPSCDPYVSSQVFGPESYKRAQLMTGLVGAYERDGFDRGTELPDHIAVVLRYAPRSPRAEWVDLVTLCLAEATCRMEAGLDVAGNPYGALFAAIRSTLEVDVPECCADRSPGIPLGVLTPTEEEVSRA